MDFGKISFIKAHSSFDSESREYAPLFRRRFFVGDEINDAKLYVCGLGYGYYYLNGNSVSPDLFTAPVSDYQKTLWYNVYDVSGLLLSGENVFAAECGNGWYNEALKSWWDQNKWGRRDVPKLKIALVVNGELLFSSDESFRCLKHSAVTYNQLRTGETFDARLYDENWNRLGFDDSNWENAVLDFSPPQGVMRECLCEPIREFEEISPVKITKMGEGEFVFDFGINMSGYARIKAKQNAGDVITLVYGERLDENGRINNNGCSDAYRGESFQTDTLICSGGEDVWKPKFTYHGFRYVCVIGIKNPTAESLTAIFVHQAVAVRTSFECSNDDINRLFKIGIRATLSNMFYMPTDCPTREKYGWMNDAQCSAEQFLTDFKSENFLAKWWQDICDSMLDNGMLPCVAPPYKIAYEWGNGPVSEGVLFEIPHRIYLHTGNAELLRQGIPYFKRNLDYYKSLIARDDKIDYGLWDWAAPERDEEKCADHIFLNDVLLVKFFRIYALALSLDKSDLSEVSSDIKFFSERVKEKYISKSGECTVAKQTAVAMLIYFDLYDDISPLANQLKRLIEEKNFHHDCGMVGLRHLYKALDKIGLQEYGYKILTARGCPSYIDWLKDGATTLYEHWDINFNDYYPSRNHHMYSDFMSWLVKTFAGINRTENTVAYKDVDINPYFFKDIDYVKAVSDTASGKISCEWYRSDKGIKAKIILPENMSGSFRGMKLKTGVNSFLIKE